MGISLSLKKRSMVPSTFMSRLDFAQFNPPGESGSLNSRLRVLVYLVVELTGDDAPASVGFQSLGDPQSADAAEGSGLYYQGGLDGGDDGAEEFKHLGLGGHGIEHAPALRMRTLGRRAMIFGLQPIACALDLSQNTALLLFFVEEAAKEHGERSQVLGVRCQEKLTGIGLLRFS